MQIPEGLNDSPPPNPNPTTTASQACAQQGPFCRGSRAPPLTCHVSLESQGLGSVVVGGRPLRQQADGLAKPLQRCAEVAGLGCCHPLQLQGLALLQLCLRESTCARREPGGAGVHPGGARNKPPQAPDP